MFRKLLAANGHSEAGADFIARATYGTYLRTLLDDARRDHPDRLEIIRGEAVDIIEGSSITTILADGREIHSDAAVLAIGNLPPHAPPEIELTPGHAARCIRLGDVANLP